MKAGQKGTDIKKRTTESSPGLAVVGKVGWEGEDNAEGLLKMRVGDEAEDV